MCLAFDEQVTTKVRHVHKNAHNAVVCSLAYHPAKVSWLQGGKLYPVKSGRGHDALLQRMFFNRVANLFSNLSPPLSTDT
jgi:hypothetical protein